jgi:hypothetical protein
VAAQEHDLVRLLPPLQLRDDVRRLRVGQKLRLHPEREPRVLAALLHPLQHLGRLDCDRGRRNLRLIGRVVHRARVRRLQTDGRDGAHERRDRPVLGRARRARAAVLHGRAVSGERHVVDDDTAARLGRARLQLVEAADDQRLARDAFGRRPHAVTQAEHREFSRDRARQLKALFAAHPVRHHHALAAHVLQPVALHLRERPLDGTLQVLRSAQAVADAIRQVGEAAVGAISGERRADDARRLLAVVSGAHARRRQRHFRRLGRSARRGGLRRGLLLLLLLPRQRGTEDEREGEGE